jgi:hypothetical protein
MAKLKLEEIADLTNIVPKLDDDDIVKIRESVLNRFSEDKGNLSEWTKKADSAMKLATLGGPLTKNQPYEGSSNVKFPLITNSSIQFASRTMPEIIRGDKVVEVAANGFDPDGSISERAARVSEFMSYQLLLDNDEWQESMDKTLHLLANVGQVFRKIFFDPVKGKYSYTICDPKSVFVSNQIQTLEEAVSISHEFLMGQNDIVSNI